MTPSNNRRRCDSRSFANSHSATDQRCLQTVSPDLIALSSPTYALLNLLQRCLKIPSRPSPRRLARTSSKDEKIPTHQRRLLHAFGPRATTRLRRCAYLPWLHHSLNRRRRGDPSATSIIVILFLSLVCVRLREQAESRARPPQQ